MVTSRLVKQLPASVRLISPADEDDASRWPPNPGSALVTQTLCLATARAHRKNRGSEPVDTALLPSSSPAYEILSATE